MSGSLADKERLTHMVEAIDRIQKFTNEMKYEEFVENEMAQFAVIKNFEIIGEAAYHTSKNTKENYPDIEWRKIEAFRHKLVHDYYEISLEIVWKSKESKIDQLKEGILEILEHFESQE